ncbi:MAG: DoxX family protein [Gemmatimonadota bacterium]
MKHAPFHYKEILMSALPTIGRFLFAVPMLVFGAMHFMMGQQMAGMVPIPGGVFWVYLTGLALLLAAISIMSGKQAALASGLLALFLVLTATTVHLPAVMGGDQAAMSNVLKDFALAGGALVLMGVFQREGEGASAG